MKETYFPHEALRDPECGDTYLVCSHKLHRQQLDDLRGINEREFDECDQFLKVTFYQ